MRCPLCRSYKQKNLLHLNAGNLDHSKLYKNIRINVCENCGHVYNNITPIEMKNLMDYYNEEYAPANLSLKVGDRPGSKNSWRYDQIYETMEPYINVDSKILDIGCAMGGFLDYLSDKGYKNLFGVDVINDYVKIAKHNVSLGTVYSIPFKEHVFDVVVLDQVLEHLEDPVKALKEIKRVLKPEGIVCVGVPDASEYINYVFFDYYWFLMREHIQHFDLKHLQMLFNMEYFELIEHGFSNLPMVSEVMRLPNLTAVFKLNRQGLRNKIEGYLGYQNKLRENKINEIRKLIDSQKPIYVYGVGRECLYLIKQCKLDECNIIDFIDDTKTKQGKTIKGRIIKDSSILTLADEDSALIITAYAHKELLKQKVECIGYKGEIINV